MKEEFEDTKGVIRIRKSKTERQQTQWPEVQTNKYSPQLFLFSNYVVFYSTVLYKRHFTFILYNKSFILDVLQMMVLSILI